jgi:hypothetical protein
MIDWQHPRIFERLRCFGLSLFSLGLASHDASDPPVAIAAIVVAMLLVLRLKIELDIGREEEESSLERKLSTSVGSIRSRWCRPSLVRLRCFARSQAEKSVYWLELSFEAHAISGRRK